MNPLNFPDAFSLKGEAALVTGGGTGLGLATAKCLAKAGARVVLVGRRAELLEKAAREIGDAAVAIPADLTKLRSLPGLAARAERAVGPLSILVNNAGILLKKPAVETEDAEYDRIIQTHLRASFALAREAARGMLQRRKGSIVFVASAAAMIGLPCVVAYSAVKSGLLGMTRSLATEWSAQGLRVNAVAPGWILTDLSRSALKGDPRRKEKILARTPMGRMGDAEDVGWAIVYLCSPAARFVTGSTLVVDGGVTIGF